MKIKNLKYILWVCLLFIFSCCFVIWADDIPTQNSCPSNLPDHSSNNGESYVNTSNWYYNNSSWLIWRYNVNSIPKYQWRTITNLITYKINLLQEHYDGPLSTSFTDANNIWHLQNAIRSTQWCDSSLHRDCRLWRDTSRGFFNCDVCKAIDTSYEEWSAWPGQCPDEFELEWWCCKPKPVITTQFWQGNRNWNVLRVDVSFAVTNATISNDNFNCDIWSFSVEGANFYDVVPEIIEEPTEIVSCELIINGSAQTITVVVSEWVVQIWNTVSPEANQTFTMPEDCGSTPKTDSGCTETYWPSYSQSGDCCVTQCSIPQKTWWNCNPWYSVNGSGCCVANNCQNLPTTWTDCSNWWWMWSYNAASGCCVKGESCQDPATPPTDWQCASPLVLDQAGECCTTCTTPADGSWNCQPWYTAQWGCCFSDDRCWENEINEWWQCKACVPWETVPNENHTRCICDSSNKCCGVQLNNVVPFIWDCIEMNGESNRDNTTNVTSVTAFPILMQWLMKILMSVIMIFSFLMIIVAWLMIVSWAFGWSWFTTGKKIIKNVIISLILLWCSWLILSLINPSFFGG